MAVVFLFGWRVCAGVALLEDFSALLTGQAADDPDGLVDASGVAEAQAWVVFAFQHFVVLDQRFAEEFEGPGVALQVGEAFLVSHGAPAWVRGWFGCGWGRRLEGCGPVWGGGGERMRGSLMDLR